MIFKLALRNLVRRRTQSLLAAGAVAGGLSLIIFTTNFQDGSWRGVVDDSIRAASGHVVVQAKGYQDEKDAELLLSDSSTIAEKVRGVAPHTHVVRRLFLQGMVASPDNAVAIALHGVEPVPESETSQVADQLTQGAWLPDDDGAWLLIGHRLAKRLNVSIDDKVVVSISHKGEIQGLPFRVAGIFETGSTQLDNFFALASLSAAQSMLPGVKDPATQVSIQVPEYQAEASLLPTVQGALSTDHEILTWQESLPELYKAELLDKRAAYFMWFFFGALASIGVLNVLLMSLFQRIREFGMLQALGMRPNDLVRLLVAEGFLLGLLGSLAGLVIGCVATYPLAVYGIDVAAMQDSVPVSNVALNTLIKGVWSWDKMLLWSGYHVLLALLASLWPALRASRLEPVESLRAT